MAQFYTIYKTTNKINGKIYIGMHETDNLNDDYLGSGKRLKRSIRYYGKEHFEKEILFIFDNKEAMVNKEIELVNEEFVNRKDTYNLALGGEGGFYTTTACSNGGTKGGLAHSLKCKQDSKYRDNVSSNMSTLVKDLWKDPEYRKMVLTKNNWKGKTHSDKSKVKMSNSSKGKGTKENNSQFGTCWITNEKENRKIFRGDLIPEGFRLGRKMK